MGSFLGNRGFKSLIGASLLNSPLSVRNIDTQRGAKDHYSLCKTLIYEKISNFGIYRKNYRNDKS